MSKIIRRLVATALVVTGLGWLIAPNVAHAQADTQAFCANTAPLLLTELPASNPCGTGQFIALQWWDDNRAGEDFDRQVFTDYGQMYELAKTFLAANGDGSVWFEPGESTAAVPAASEVTTRTLTANGAKLGKNAKVSEQNDPPAWTEGVCNGDSAAVFQSVKRTGDGVTIGVDDPVGCETDGYWFVVEPWGAGQMNPDSGCLAKLWSSDDESELSTVRSVAHRNQWLNGSVWRVDKKYAENPLVVDCAKVTGPETLGLNRYENQVKLARLPWVRERAQQLLQAANMTLAKYCETFGSEPLGSQILCIEFVK